jgi:hypothetical protein
VAWKIEYKKDSPIGEVWMVETKDGWDMAFSEEEAIKMSKMFSSAQRDLYRFFKRQKEMGMYSEEDIKRIEEEIEKGMSADPECTCKSFDLAHKGHDEHCPLIISRKSERNMNIRELIKLADLLDSRGEHDAASEIDKLIRSAGPLKYKSCPHMRPDGSAEHIHDECQVEETDPNIEQPQWMEDEPTEVDPTAGKYAPSEMLDEPTVPGEPDVSVGRRSKEYLAIRKMLQEAEQNMDPEVYEELKDAVGMLAASVEEHGPPDYDSDDKTASVFARLSKVADDLDEVGARKGADMIDAFLAKYAEEGPSEMGELPQLEEEPLEGPSEMGGEDDSFLQAVLEKVERTLKEIRDQAGEGGMQAAAMELEQLLHSLSGSAGEVSKLGGVDGFLAKHAEGDYDEDRKEEGDTEQSKRYDSKHHHNLQIREPKTDKERVDREGRKEHHVETYKQVEAHHLSTRYCPEHVGTQMGRVGQGVFQCPLDGQVYNWETGWTDFDGNQHPGGSVAAQTPDSTGYAIPHRIFDSREKVLNVVN